MYWDAHQLFTASCTLAFAFQPEVPAQPVSPRRTHFLSHAELKVVSCTTKLFTLSIVSCTPHNY